MKLDYLAVLMSKVGIVPCNTSEHAMQGCIKSQKLKLLVTLFVFFLFFLALLELDPSQCAAKLPKTIAQRTAEGR